MGKWDMKIVVKVVLIILSTAVLTDALLCYRCGAKLKDCIEDTNGMTKTAVGDTRQYFKNCTFAHANYTMCSIERISTQGDTKSYIRGCSDGRTFSFPISGHLVYIKPNNQTVCTFDMQQKRKYCLTLCKSDFCNGPSSVGSVQVTVLNILMALMSYGFLREL